MSIRIQVGELYSTVLEPRIHMGAISIIRDVCKARPAGYQFMPKYKARRWDGYSSLMRTFNAFPSGLLPMVLTALKSNGYNSIELVKPEPIACLNTLDENILSGITLRDYQLEAAKHLIENKRGVAKMATNSGKTEVMAAVIKAFGRKAVVLVHRKELMYQTAQRFIDRGIENVGMVGDSLFDPKDVTVAMIQTLHNRVDLSCFFGNVVLFIDECHTLSSDEAQDVYFRIPGYHRYGVSGTPLKHDTLSDMRLMAATGPVIFEITNDFLISRGYSARPTIEICVIEQKDDDELDYHDAYDKFIVNNAVRNKKIADYAKAIDGAVLILVSRVEHGKILESMTGGKFVSGSDTTATRQAALAKMKKGSGITIASPIFDEGVDVPGVNAVILAGGGSSHIKLLQRIGRGLRQKSNGNELKVLDFIDDTSAHLLKHSNDRIDTYAAEGFETVII